jgi:Metallo-peptidase family M12
MTNFYNGQNAPGQDIIRGIVDGSGLPIQGPIGTIDNSIAPGRFQGGTVKVGNLTFSGRVASTQFPDVALTLVNRSYPKIFEGLNCMLRKDANNLNLSILNILNSGPNEFTVRIPNTPTLPSFEGGKVSIGGGQIVNIVLLPSTSPNYLKAFKVTSLSIAIKLLDDDNINQLPTDLVADATAQSILKSDFMESYIDPVLDGGGNISYNNSEQIDFSINIPTGFAAATLNTYYEAYSQSKALETPANLDSYWVSYLVLGWQPLVGEDFDPYVEGASLGLSPYYQNTNNCDDVSVSLDMAFFSVETLRDVGFSSRIGKITTHELGHQLGLTHFLKNDGMPTEGCVNCTTTNICEESQAKIMYYKYNPNADYAFCNQHINHLRSRKFSPKR